MKITVLVENSVCSSKKTKIRGENGLSLYIELGEKKILFDTGQSNLFIRNAEKMGIDLSEVDYLIISHGHFDHGGGIKHFLKLNKKAKVYLHKNAIHKYYTKIFGFIPYYVGLNQKIITQYDDRFCFVRNDTLIEDYIIILENFPNIYLLPEANKTLFKKMNKRYISDKFRHEIALLLKEDSELVLFSGCSHSGILNIVEKVNIFSPNGYIKAIFGGFHTYNPITKKSESKNYINKLTKGLDALNTIFYTGHCTGDKNISFINEKLGKKIQRINSGKVIEI